MERDGARGLGAPVPALRPYTHTLQAPIGMIHGAFLSSLGVAGRNGHVAEW